MCQAKNFDKSSLANAGLAARSVATDAGALVCPLRGAFIYPALMRKVLPAKVNYKP